MSVFYGRDFLGSPEYLEVQQSVLLAHPVTLAGLAVTPNMTASQTVLGINSTTTAESGWALSFSGATAGDPVSILVMDSSSGNVANSTTSYTAGRLHCLHGVCSSATSRAAFIDGGSKGTNAVSRVPANINTFTLGRESGNNRNYFVGQGFEWAVWNIALSDAEVAVSARHALEGLGFGLVQRQALVGWWRVDNANSTIIRDLTPNRNHIYISNVTRPVRLTRQRLGVRRRVWAVTTEVGGGLVAQERSMMRRVSGRIFGRVN